MRIQHAGTIIPFITIPIIIRANATGFLHHRLGFKVSKECHMCQKYNQNLTHRYLGLIVGFVMNSLVEYVFFEVDQSKASKVFP